MIEIVVWYTLQIIDTGAVVNLKGTQRVQDKFLKKHYWEHGITKMTSSFKPSLVCP